MSRVAGIATAVALAAGALAVARPQAVPRAEVTVVMRDSRFHPAHLTVPSGVPVRLTVVNEDPIAHEIVIGDEAEQQRHELEGTQGHDGLPGQADLEIGETQVLTVAFPAGTGTTLFACHVPGHYAYGMRGTIRVAG